MSSYEFEVFTSENRPLLLVTTGIASP